MPGRTLIALMESSAARFADEVYLMEKVGGQYQGTTYRETRERVRRFAAGLLALGLRKGDRVALISEARNLWVIAELGILYAAGVNVPISVKINEPHEIKFRLAHSGCRMVIVSGQQAPKVSAIKQDLPDLETVILLDGKEDGPDEIGVKRLLRMGEDWLAENSEAFDATLAVRWGERPGEHLLYLRDHRGPEGCGAHPSELHRQRGAGGEDAAYPLTLALPHHSSLGPLLRPHRGDLHPDVLRGQAGLGSAGGLPHGHAPKYPGEHQGGPSPFHAQRPRPGGQLPEEHREGESVSRAPGWRGSSDAALRNAYAYNGAGWNRGKGLEGLRTSPPRGLRRLVFSRVRESLGGAMEFFVSGGALLDADTQRFFHAIGIPMYQGYGLTEAAPVISTNIPGGHKIGSSGRVLPGLEIRICDSEDRDLPVGEKGEIAVRGENVMAGYWRNPDATATAIRGRLALHRRCGLPGFRRLPLRIG